MKWIVRILSGLGLVVFLAVVAVVGLFTIARFHDGPFEGALEIVAAGAFQRRRVVEVPMTALSNLCLRASAGNEKRWFVVTGSRSKGGEKNTVSYGSTMSTRA